MSFGSRFDVERRVQPVSLRNNSQATNTLNNSGQSAPTFDSTKSPNHRSTEWSNGLRDFGPVAKAPIDTHLERKAADGISFRRLIAKVGAALVTSTDGPRLVNPKLLVSNVTRYTASKAIAKLATVESREATDRQRKVKSGVSVKKLSLDTTARLRAELNAAPTMAAATIYAKLPEQGTRFYQHKVKS